MSTTEAVIDVEQFEVRRTVRIAAPVEIVWAALTEASQIGQWFGQSADFPDGVHEGAEGTFGWTEHGDFPVRIDQHEPRTAFAFTWGTPGEPIRDDNSTTATFAVAQEGDETVVTVVESGFDTLGEAAGRRAAMEENAQGWTEELDDLVAHVAALLAGSPPRVDDAAGTITRTVLVRVPRERVWAHLVDPAAIEAWWGHPARFPGGVREGAEGTFEWTGHGLMPMRVECFDPPTHFDLRWGALGDETPGPGASLVEFTLDEAGADGTLVTVVETGFSALSGGERERQIADNVQGWTHVLDALARYAEEHP